MQTFSPFLFPTSNREFLNHSYGSFITFMLSVMVHGSENHTLDRDRRTGSKRKDPDVDETNREDVRAAGIRLLYKQHLCGYNK